MPNYVYRCEKCNKEVEIYRRVFERDIIVKCSYCKKRMKRVLFPVSVQYKATGFYSTDKKR